MAQGPTSFETFFARARDGMILARPGGAVVRANSAACRALGRGEEELRGAGLAAVAVDEARLRQLLAAAGGAAGALLLRRGDGRTFLAELTVDPLPASELVAVVFHAAVRSSEELLTGITEASPDCIFLKDADSRWLFANPATLQVIGKSLDQVLGATDREIYADPRIGADLMEIDRRIMTSGAGEVVEETVQTPAGYRVYLSTKTPTRDAAGRVTGLVGIARDITEQKRAADELATQQQLLSSVIDGTPSLIFAFDAEGRVTLVNEAAARFSRMSKEALIGHRPEESVSAELGRDILERHRQVMATGEPHVAEVVVPRPDGDRTLIAARYPLRDARGRIYGTASITTDVTEQRRVAAALRESEERLQEAQRHAGIGSWRWVPGGPLAWSDQMYEIYRVPRETTVTSELAASRVHPEDLQSRYQAAFERALRSPGSRIESEFRIVWPDGQIRTLWVLGRVRRDAEGRPVEALGTVLDVTERKRIEAERERLATAIEQGAEAVVVTDAAGAITYVNPAFEAVTGYRSAEVLGRNPSLLKSGAHDAAVYRELWETISGGNVWHGRLVNRKKDGTTYTEDASISPVRDAGGTIAGYVAVMRDVTRTLALEAQLLQSQKMESIGRLAGGVAHDFNNILSVILSCADSALGSIPERHPLRGDLVEIERAGKRAATLTRQLLAFSRKQMLQPEQLDLNRVLGDTEKMLRRIIGEDIDLAQSLAPDLWKVKADPGQIEQVIMNLVVNARDAMPSGGKLTIETANVELGAGSEGAAPGPHVMVAVRDSGVGMTEATMARLFEPFFTTKGAGKGTGLGLSTVYGIVTQSGGSISVDSAPGTGTTFRLYLPRDTSPPAAAREPHAAARLHGGETILLVEDDDAVRKAARRMLDRAGYRVLPAASAAEALQLCESSAVPIELVLTDVVMPEMGGRAFVDRLEKLRAGIKVLYMSGYADDAIVHHGFLDPGTNFIAKPFTQDVLLRKIREVLGG